MFASFEALQTAVLRLSPSERSRLLERLFASLEAEVGVEAAWDAVADARDNELESGALIPVSLDEAMARLEARFKG